jgi:GWxTD domain-containing protein
MTHAGALMLVLALGPRHALTPQDRLWLASVDHVITKAEREEYEAFDDAERRSFQDAFWRARDPDPDTPQNEALQEYVERLHFVEHYFQENEVPGVFTERGRMYALRQTCVSQDRRHARAGRRQQVWLTARLGGWRRAGGDLGLRQTAGLEAGEVPRHHLRGREQDQPFRPPERRVQAATARSPAVGPIRDSVA